MSPVSYDESGPLSGHPSDRYGVSGQSWNRDNQGKYPNCLSSSHQEGVFPPKEGVTGFLFFYDDGHLAVSRDVSMGDTDGQKLPSWETRMEESITVIEG